MKIKTIDVNKWTLFAVFGLSIFVKCILFHFFCFNYVAVSSLWNAPHDFLSFYVAKLFPAVSIASFSLIFKRKWWIIVASFIIDLWLSANFIYYRANDLFLDTETIMIADNLNGFWSSIVAYLNWKTISFVVVSVLLYVFLAFTKVENKRKWKEFAVASAVSVLLFVGDNFAGYSIDPTKGKYSAFKVAKSVSMGDFYSTSFVCNQWIEAQTPLHFFPSFIYKEICVLYYESDTYTLSESDMIKIEEVVDNAASDSDTVYQNLIFILGESFESWALQMKDDSGTEITPNLNRYKEGTNCLYANKIRTQIRRGTSGDGQMIVQTGLLPIESPVACMKYGENVYPNYAHKYDSAIIVNPAHGVWNQSIVTYSYGYKKLVEDLIKKGQNDEQAFQMALKSIPSDEPFCMFVITISTHTPFSCPRKTSLSFNKELPEMLVNYMNCMHYADSCIGVFLNELEKDSLLQNTTLVITGDHTIFRSNLLAEMRPTIEKYGLPIPKDETFCPLIISSPTITKHTEIDTLCYQMDIYPTILHCLGIKDYYWNGFGVNLLDSTSLQNRKITEEEAFELSNLIIRSNYFKDLNN